MDLSMLTNPRPSQGYNAVLGNIPASSAPPQGTLAGLRPSVQNNVKEPMVNPVASYPILVKPYSNNMERYLHPGDLIFVYTNENDQTNNHSAVRRGQPVPVANLPMLNFLMASTDDHFEKFRNRCCWQFLGVMRNDMQLSKGDLGMNNRYKTYRRLINVDVRGATRCFNYWANADQGNFAELAWTYMKRRGPGQNTGHALLNSEDLRDLKRLGAEIEADIAKERATNVPPLARDVAIANLRGEQTFRDKETRFNGRYVQQLVPSSYPYEAHPLYIGAGQSETSLEQRADDRQTPFAFRVGWCFQNVGAAERVNSATAVLSACTFQEDRFKLPLFNVFLRA